MASQTGPPKSPLQDKGLDVALRKRILIKLATLEERVSQSEHALSECRLAVQEIQSDIIDAGRPMTDEKTNDSKSNVESSKKTQPGTKSPATQTYDENGPKSRDTKNGSPPASATQSHPTSPPRKTITPVPPLSWKISSSRKILAPKSSADKVRHAADTQTHAKKTIKPQATCPKSRKTPAATAVSQGEGEDDGARGAPVNKETPAASPAPTHAQSAARKTVKPRHIHPPSRKSPASTSAPDEESGTENGGGNKTEPGEAESGNGGGSYDKSDDQEGEKRETSGPSYSARANGPLEDIPGMEFGSGTMRILPTNRWMLPLALGGTTYSCEARCGYPDWACEMIVCDSFDHVMANTIVVSEDIAIERGWYHKPCGGMPVEYFPAPGETFFCPACLVNDINRRTIGGYEGNDGADGSDETEDDQRQNTPEEDYADEDDADDADDADDDNDAVHHGEDDTEDEYQPTGVQHEDSSSSSSGVDDTDDDTDLGRGDDGHYSEAPAIKGDARSNEPTSKQPTRVKGKTEAKQKVLSDHTSLDDGQEDFVIFGNDKTKWKDNEPREDEIWITKEGDPWLEKENLLCMDFMREICEAGEIKGEDRFFETSQRMVLRGYQRNWTAVKNAWNRRLRERSSLDERRKKGPVLATSKQDKETKKRNQEKRKEKEQAQAQEQERQGRQQSRMRRTKGKQDEASSRSLSSKREHESDGEDEVLPAKRRRSGPYDGDFFAGLP